MNSYCNRYWIQFSEKLYFVIYVLNSNSNLKYNGCYKKNITDLRFYYASVSDTVHYSTINRAKSDYDRSVGILRGYVGTNDLQLADDD